MPRYRSRRRSAEILRCAQADTPTLIAIAVLAFVLADVAHEVIGNGVAYVAVGGRSFVMTTTRLIGQGVHVDASGRLFVGVAHGNLYGKFFALGGPLGSLVFAALSWLAQRFQRRFDTRLHLFFWLTMAFNLFWGFGYLIFSGVTNSGDWAESIRGIPPAWGWRIVMIVAGILLYRFSMKVLAGEMRWFIRMDEPDCRSRVRHIVWISYWAAGVISCAGAVFDPRGADQVYKSGAVVSFVGALGLLSMPILLQRFPRQSEAAPGIITRSVGCIVGAVVVSGIYIGVLGPGLRISF